MTSEAAAKEPVRVLVVDDQAGMRLTLKGILTKRGYQVTTAEDGHQALELAGKTDFRLVLMDIKMPGMNGVETFVKLKGLNSRASVIMMTAFAMQEEIEQAIREGAFTVVYKPFEIPKILSVIESCLDDRTLILLVDDNKDILAVLQEVFEKKGFKVCVAESGEECLRKAQEMRFQIILLDIKLPGIDGVETLKRLRQARPSVAVIMMTGHSVEDLIDDAIKTGSYACIRKPFDLGKVIETIDHCLKRERPSA